MKTKQWTTIDRVDLGWPSGEWDDEPDKVQWPDEATGLPCLAVRHRDRGNWCGYVGVAEGHPLFKQDGDGLEVHGGVTFGGMCRPGPESSGICHVPGKGEPDHVWWLGFDCAHAGDLSPHDYAQARKGGIWRISSDARYRSLAFVKKECRDLAAQLAASPAPAPDKQP